MVLVVKVVFGSIGITLLTP
ncbi:hypothetical protein CGH38_22945 [Vibrio parahaemolyticus]|nr:hypothetical protein CGH38_22945 [Vibrio parahaemolyticus]